MTCDNETVTGLCVLTLVLAVTVPVIPFAIMYGLEVHSDHAYPVNAHKR